MGKRQSGRRGEVVPAERAMGAKASGQPIDLGLPGSGSLAARVEAEAPTEEARQITQEIHQLHAFLRGVAVHSQLHLAELLGRLREQFRMMRHPDSDYLDYCVTVFRMQRRDAQELPELPRRLELSEPLRELAAASPEKALWVTARVVEKGYDLKLLPEDGVRQLVTLPPKRLGQALGELFGPPPAEAPAAKPKPQAEAGERDWRAPIDEVAMREHLGSAEHMAINAGACVHQMAFLGDRLGEFLDVEPHDLQAKLSKANRRKLLKAADDLQGRLDNVIARLMEAEG